MAHISLKKYKQTEQKKTKQNQKTKQTNKQANK